MSSGKHSAESSKSIAGKDYDDLLSLENNPLIGELSGNLQAIMNILLSHLKEEHAFSDAVLEKAIAKSLLRSESLPQKTADSKISVSESAAADVFAIPVSAFSEELSSLETIVKYLVEVRKLKKSKIAELTNRNVRTIWTTYSNAQKKYQKALVIEKDESFFIPISAFRDRSFSSLEIIVRHLKEHYSLSLRKIAIMLKRDDSTIWTVYSRAKKKERTAGEIVSAAKVKDEDETEEQ